MLHQLGCGQKAKDWLAAIDDQRRGRVDLIASCQLREEPRIYRISGDMRIEDRQLVGQPGHMAAYGSRWRDKYLKMDRGVEQRQCLLDTGVKLRLTDCHQQQQIADECRELIVRRRPERAHESC